MKLWRWLALVFLLLGVVGVMFWVTGIGEEAEPLFEPIETTQEIPTSDPRKLSVWAYGSDETKEFWSSRIATFEEAIGEQVELTMLADAAAYRQLLAEAKTQGKLPDLMLLNATQAAELAADELLAPLALPPDVAKDWVAPSVSAMAYPEREGSVAAYPSDFSILVLYYNKQMLDGKGMAYPGDHWTWSILTGIAKSLYRKGEEGEVTSYGLEMPLSLDYWNALAVQFGAPVYAERQWLVADAEAEAPPVKALAFLLDFYYRYAIVAPPQETGVGRYFLRGESALSIAGTDLLPALTKAEFPWGVTMMPKEDRHATPLQVEGWGVKADSAKAREAAELALLLASESQRLGWLPARLSESVEGTPFALFYEQLENAVLPPRLALPADAPEVVFQLFTQVIESGDIKPVAVVQTLGQKLGVASAQVPAESAAP